MTMSEPHTPRLLAGFWLRRFVRIFAIASVVLVAVQTLREGITMATLVEPLLWAAATATFVASINTWWAWTHGCQIKS